MFWTDLLPIIVKEYATELLDCPSVDELSEVIGTSNWAVVRKTRENQNRYERCLTRREFAQFEKQAMLKRTGEQAVDIVVVAGAPEIGKVYWIDGRGPIIITNYRTEARQTVFCGRDIQGHYFEATIKEIRSASEAELTLYMTELEIIWSVANLPKEWREQRIDEVEETFQVWKSKLAVSNVLIPSLTP